MKGIWCSAEEVRKADNMSALQLDEINEDYPNEPEDALLRLFDAIRKSTSAGSDGGYYTDDPRLLLNFSSKFPTEGQGVNSDLGADSAAVAVERVERTTYGSDGHLCRHVERHGGKEDTELKRCCFTRGQR
jgi:hypothetical protein